MGTMGSVPHLLPHPRVSRQLQATLGPPQFCPSLRYLNARSSVILNVVSLENQRLVSFRLLWLLLVRVLGMGGPWLLAPVSRASPWVRRALDRNT